LEILKAKGTDVHELASNSIVYEKAFKTIYKTIPIPWRWFIGKKRVRQFLDMAKDKVLRPKG
jgi:hypothetical protein